MPKETANAGETPIEGEQNSTIESSAHESLFTAEQQEIVNKLVGKARQDAAKKNANYETYKKAYEELEQLKEHEKTDLDRANDRATKAEQELQGLRHEKELLTWAREVGQEFAVPSELLRGETREEMESHAQELKNYLKKESAPYVPADGWQAQNDAPMTAKQAFGAYMDSKLKHK